MPRTAVLVAALAALAGCGGAGPPGDSLGDNDQVFVLDRAGGDPHRLTDDTHNYTTPVWSPRGDQLASSFGSGIVLFSPDGRRLKQFHVANVNGDAPLAWSYDGRRLAFEATYDNPRTGSTDARLLTLDARNGARRTLARPAAGTPSWSTGDRALVYLTGDLVIDTKAIRQGVWKVSAAGGRPHRLASRVTDDFSPQLSADGRRLLFARPHSVWISRADGSRQVRLMGGIDEAIATWAPNDRDVAVFGYSGGNNRAFVVSRARRRRDLPRIVDSGPLAWSPDGRLIAWVSYAEGGAALIQTERPDGTGHRVLTRMAKRVLITGLAWSPDSRRLAFSASKSNAD